MKVIRLPNGRRVTLGAYVAAWRHALTLPADATIGDWQCFPVTTADVLADFRAGVHDRINRHLPAVDVKRTPHARLARLIAEGRVERLCHWCGNPFRPESVHHKCCDETCRRAYYS